MTPFYLLDASKAWYRQKYYYFWYQSQKQPTGYSTVNKKITEALNKPNNELIESLVNKKITWSMDGLHNLKEKP